MIKSIYSTSTHLTVSNNSMQTYIPQCGALWWDGGSQQMKVFDGNSYHSIYPGEARIVAPMLDTVVDWAMTKMAEEKRIKELAATHPGVKALADQVEEVTEKLNAFAALVSENHNAEG